MYNKDQDVNNLQNTNLGDDIEKVKNKVRETGQAFSQAARDAKDKAQTMVKQGVEEVRTKSNDLQEVVAAYVQENPVKALGFGVLAGMVLALLLRRH